MRSNFLHLHRSSSPAWRYTPPLLATSRALSMGSEIQVEQGPPVRRARPCLKRRRRRISPRTFTSKPSPLASAKTSYFAFIQRLDLFSRCVQRARRRSKMRSPGIPSPGLSCELLFFKRAYGTGTKVTEKLTPAERPADAKPHAAARAAVDESRLASQSRISMIDSR